MDVRDPVGEEGRQDPEARADLEDDVLRPQLCEALDHPEHVLGRPGSAGRGPSWESRESQAARPNAAIAFASIRASSASGSSPRAAASTASVWRTFMGSFGPAADGLRREVRGVGLDEDPVGRGHASALTRSSVALG